MGHIRARPDPHALPANVIDSISTRHFPLSVLWKGHN